MATRRGYIDLQNQDRRNFVKWTLGIGAALGLRPWKVFEVAESVVGSAAAQAMATRATNLSLHCNFLTGAHAWNTQLFPVGQQHSIVGGSYYKPNQAVAVEGSNKPMMIAPDLTAFRTGNKQMTAFLCGTNESHTGQARSTMRMPSGNSLIAYAAALQQSNPTLVPMVFIGGGNNAGVVGQAAGAPPATVVPSAIEFANLFAAKAGQAGFALADQGNANKYSAYQKAYYALNRAANRSTFATASKTQKSALSILMQKLGDQLKPTAADLNRYGVDVAGVPGKVVSLAQALISTTKAWQLNLTNSVSLDCFGDDPHGAFNNMAQTVTTVESLCRVWNAFMADVESMADPQSANQKIGDNLVMTWTGDTYKNPRKLGSDNNGGNGTDWSDGTPSTTNILYVMSGGRLKTGWFGDIHPTTDASTKKWNPATGEDVPLSDTSVPSINNLALSAATATAIAINKGKDLPSLTTQLPSLAGIANLTQQ